MLFYCSIHPEWDFFGSFSQTEKCTAVSTLLETVATAHYRNTGLFDYGDYLTARFTTVKSEFHIYLLSDIQTALLFFFQFFYFVKYLLVLVEEEEYRADETRDRGDYRRDTEAHLTA